MLYYLRLSLVPKMHKERKKMLKKIIFVLHLIVL